MEFYIAKNGKQRPAHTPHRSRYFFYNSTFHDVVHCLLFELHNTNLFVSLSSVMSQNTGTLIKGSMLAPGDVINRELRGILLKEFTNLLWLHYTDIFRIVHDPGTAGFSMDKWRAGEFCKRHGDHYRISRTTTHFPWNVN